jgi:integrase
MSTLQRRFYNRLISPGSGGSSAAQIEALLAAARKLDVEATRFRHVNRHAIVATLVFAGLRISELLNLRWADVDLANGWLTVGESKTDAGIRKVKMRPVLRDVFAECKPTDADPAALVFGTSEGKRQSPSNVRRRVLMKAAEGSKVPLPALTPHSLRRTFCSLLFALGEPHPVVMREMGHTDAKLTLNVYAEVMDRDEKENERLRALVNGESWRRLGTGAQTSDPRGDAVVPAESDEARS